MKVKVYEKDYLTAKALKLELEAEGYFAFHGDELKLEDLDEFDLIISDISYINCLLMSLKNAELDTPVYILSSSWTNSLSMDIKYESIIGQAYKPFMTEDVISDLKKYLKEKEEIIS